MNDTFCPGDMLRVQERSRAAIVLSNEVTLRLDQNTTITFAGLEQEQTLLLRLLSGAAYFFSRIPRSLKFTTPFVNGIVEGTEFFVEVDYYQTFISVFAGRVLAANEAGSLILESGQSALTQRGQAITPQVVARPRDAVQWAIHYPPIIAYRAEDFPGDTDWQAKVRRSIEFYWEGDLRGAFSILDGLPQDISDPRFYTYRAGLLLTVGRVEEARADIERTLELEPTASHASALQAIIGVAQNQKVTALELAKKAVELDPESSVARVSLSYAQQASFNLEGALNSLREAVKLDSENALAWARLSELWQSFGYLDRSLEAAQKAVALNPQLARTQTVLGFAYLTQVRIDDSKSAFEEAIRLDQASPLPRLGLGLAKIRDGDLKEGTGEIEIAASLDPNNSLIRSYLGKAYYEEKRTELDGPQFAIAKELDPQDPTPWFYDAIRKQTVNRPVEALHDLQKSIELNNNRAVFRSRLLLDQDLAARSASLGRIYNDLGFQQLGLIEGWRSVNIDPSNFSAHRLLADLYAALPRHEIARVSELLQSQLLQPLNITPVQPSLAEANLFILDGAGPSDPSFNEFNPLFLRNQFALQANGIAGDNNTLGGEIIQSTVWGRWSYSLGAFRYQTDGFRENNDLDQDIYNVFAQVSLSPKTSVQAEFRYLDRENGQLDLLFDPDISLAFQEERKADSLRFGFHHGFSPGSDIIGSFIYQSVDIDQNQTPRGGVASVDGKTRRDGYILELQHLLRKEKFNLTTGIGYIEQDIEDSIVIDQFPTFLPPIFPGLPPIPVDLPPIEVFREEAIFNRTNLYAYSQIDVLDSLNLTIGLSADLLERGKQVNRDQVNPKLGLTWQARQGTTLRLAAFRELGSRLFFNQTIEPTQVAGFNQFFDDINGTDSWRYGAAVDQIFSSHVYGGVEYSYRTLDVPILTDPETVAKFVDWNEQFGRAYLYWTPHPWIALSAEYQYERFDREDNPLRGVVDVKTHRVPLGFNFFHPSGIALRVDGTYYYQSGDFHERDSVETIFSDRDDFWLVDLAVQYRLPKRYGLISFGVKNVFDEDFLFQDTDPSNPQVVPERFVFGRVTLSF
jgi:tetratricopeptide (TPR) repeat protein